MSRVPFIGRAVERLLPGAVVQILAEQIAEGGAGARQRQSTGKCNCKTSSVNLSK